MDNTNNFILDKKRSLLLKAILAIQDQGWLVWNPSQQGKNTIFDIASLPPKSKESDEWDDEKMMVYKVVTDENLGDMGLCLDEVKHYKALPIFIVESKEMAIKIANLARQGEDKKWTLMVIDDTAQKEKKTKVLGVLADISASLRKLIHNKESFKN